MKILAFTGPKGSGKSALADRMELSPLADKPVLRLTFAGAIKDALSAAGLVLPGGWLPENKENPAFGICGRSPRFLAQELGTKYGRETVHPEVWVDLVNRKLGQTDAATVIVDDLRFQNEAEMLLSWGAKIYLVSRPGVDYTREHASEYPLPTALLDGVVENDGLDHLDALAQTWNPFV